MTMASGHLPGVKYDGDPYDHKMATHVRRTTETVDDVQTTAKIEVYNEGASKFVLSYTPSADRSKPLSGTINVPEGSLRLLDFVTLFNFLVEQVNKG